MNRVEKASWTILVWSLFAIVILGPLFTVVAFSFTHNVFQGASFNSTEWYRQLFSDPQMYGPLIRSFEVALLVVLSSSSARSSRTARCAAASSAPGSSTRCATSRSRCPASSSASPSSPSTARSAR